MDEFISDCNTPYPRFLDEDGSPLHGCVLVVVCETKKNAKCGDVTTSVTKSQVPTNADAEA